MWIAAIDGSVLLALIGAPARKLKMRPNDIKTMVGLLERRKHGRRFNAQSAYRDHHF